MDMDDSFRELARTEIQFLTGQIGWFGGFMAALRGSTDVPTGVISELDAQVSVWVQEMTAANERFNAISRRREKQPQDT